jgi:hypothetical protein
MSSDAPAIVVVSRAVERLERLIRRELAIGLPGLEGRGVDDRDQLVEWVQIVAAARLACVSVSTLHRAAVAGEVPFAVVAGKRFFRPDDVVEWGTRRTAARSARAPRVREGGAK